MGFPKARPGNALTLDVANNSIEAGARVDDGVGRDGEMVWWSPWVVDTAPSAGEGLAVIFSLAGDWPYRPQEVTNCIGGSHLGAIGSRILTPRIEWPVHAPVSAGQQFDIFGESYDTVASNGRAGATFFYEQRHPSLPQIYSLFERETQTTAAGETATAGLTLNGAATIVTLVGITVPSGTATADIEIAGRYIVRSDSLRPVSEVSWDMDPYGALEATSGQLNTAQVAKVNVRLDSTVPSPVLTGAVDLDVAQTTQTAESGIGARFIKRTQEPNPRL